MTVIGAVILWLKQFQTEDATRMKTIDTDIQGEDEYTYSVVKEPIQNVKTYISGKKVYTEHYTLQARLPSRYNQSRIENQSFGEQLEEWVQKQAENKNFPVLENAKVKDISITTPFYMGRTNENNSVYQMTVALKYEKER